MEIYILDQSLRRAAIVDQYISFIWSERQTVFGDFELKMVNDRSMRDTFLAGTLLTIAASQRVMRVETVETETTAEGEQLMTVTGRELLVMLDDRPARPSLTPLATLEDWVLTGTPGAIMRQMFQTVCVTGGNNAGDIMGLYTAGQLNASGNITEPADSITLSLPLDTLYNVMKEIGDQYHLGFRIVRKDNGVNPAQLYFEVYSGSNRTSSQSLLPAVIFSAELDNLTSVNSLTSVASYKNVAYVYGKYGTAVVYADNVDPSVSGFERRVLTVDANDIDLPVGAALTAALTQKGKEELGKNRAIIAFDGEISEYTAYKYGVDYNLGDLVEKRDVDGKVNIMRVTEQIFVTDSEGTRTYPTLTYDLLITPGSWYAWAANQVWEDMGLEEWNSV